MAKEKSGMGYRLLKADYPELFNGFRIVNEFQCKDETKVILNYTEVERQGDTFQFVSTDEYKAVIVYIPIANMPVELANMLQMVSKDGRAVIPIDMAGTQRIFIGGDRLEGAVFPDCFEFLPHPDDTKYLERIELEIPAKKEGETYKGTGGATFYRARDIIGDFTGLSLGDRSLELFQKMNVVVYRDAALEEQFIIAGGAETFNFIAVMTAISKGAVVVLSPEEIREAAEAGAIQDGQVCPKIRKPARRKKAA
jgi:hypothetical protein